MAEPPVTELRETSAAIKILSHQLGFVASDYLVDGSENWGQVRASETAKQYALAVHELVQAKIEQRAPEVEIETEKRDRVGLNRLALR